MSGEGFSVIIWGWDQGRNRPPELAVLPLSRGSIQEDRSIPVRGAPRKDQQWKCKSRPSSKVTAKTQPIPTMCRTKRARRCSTVAWESTPLKRLAEVSSATASRKEQEGHSSCPGRVGLPSQLLMIQVSTKDVSAQKTHRWMFVPTVFLIAKT